MFMYLSFPTPTNICMKWACVIHKVSVAVITQSKLGSNRLGFYSGTRVLLNRGNCFWGNGHKLELAVLLWSKTDVPEYNSDREGCLPNLIGQHPFSPVFGQKRPVAPDY